ncbi:MAG: ribosomal RNA small subunit methyltransferase A [Phycisphaerae bacterium]|nr:ribosomal RNA small subunit methyltransferase A [Phycisphaerae bacterium]
MQTKREIEALLTAAGIHPKRRFGQHFLIDGNLMRRLVEVADIHPADLVLEVGAGTGGLTDLLVERAGAVVAVEIDHHLFALLSERFAQSASLTLVRGDALDSKHRIATAVREAIRSGRQQASGELLLVANLPYDIATPLLVNLILSDLNVKRLCFTVQREVGERMEGRPGTKAYGPLSILLQTLCRIERIARVPAEAFWPRPAVESSLYRLDVIEDPPVTGESLASFASLVQAGFRHRRKTLRFNLDHAFGQAVCDQAGRVLDLSVRAEMVAPAQWVELACVTRATDSAAASPDAPSGPSE